MTSVTKLLLVLLCFYCLCLSTVNAGGKGKNLTPGAGTGAGAGTPPPAPAAAAPSLSKTATPHLNGNAGSKNPFPWKPVLLWTAGISGVLAAGAAGSWFFFFRNKADAL